MKMMHHLIVAGLSGLCLKFSSKSRFFAATLAIFAPTAVFAIPSPELVLGSVSSLSQVLAVVFASLSGLGAVVATRLGFKPRANGTKYPTKLIVGLTLVAVALAVLNHWQWTTYKTEEQARLQATLLRPAQFSGTKIKDATLKETSFTAQTDHPQAITTDTAYALLSSGQARFFDIRETAENAMGTLPGATHVRFPDFRQSVPVQPGEQVVLFCHNGNRSSETCAELAKMGIDCRFIAGGIEKWIVEGRTFSDASVETLADLRAIPEYPGKTTLLNTADFTARLNSGDVQIVDTRYPGDFASGHLPGAINIPIRAMTTADLKARIATLAQKPTIAACYDRRSCFMGQVLGLELTQAGIPFEGRYTLPWEYFEAPAPKPHVAEWLAAQDATLWSAVIDAVSETLLWVHNRSHILLGLFGFALLSRLLVLKIAIKSERDQMVTRANQAELDQIKADHADDPARKARAVQGFYTRHGLTPMKNLIALAFLPVMMLGVSAAEQAAGSIVTPFLWLKDIGAPDGTYAIPAVFTLLAGVYLVWAVAKTRRQAYLWCGLGLPALMWMVTPLSAAANLYLCMSLLLLLVQRGYVTGDLPRLWARLRRPRRSLPDGIIPLGRSEALSNAGNKALRLSQMAEAGLPVPFGLVMRSDALDRYAALGDRQKDALAARLWAAAGKTPVAVRSSASHEDGAEQSFAGVFDSVLDVSEAKMRAALDAVNASFNSARAASYEGEASGHGNILIQQMVDADYAGVLFTQDPTAPGMTMVEWVEGCGEDLVSGRVTPATARFGRYTGLAAEEDSSHPFDLEPLLTLGKRIEQLFGAPQDIEWAYVNGQFRILQSRDITTLRIGSEAERARVAEWRAVLDRFEGAAPDTVILEQDEMSEVLPRPTPLSFSVMTGLWAPGGALDLACRSFGLPYRLPEGADAHLVRLFGKTYVDTALKQKLALDLSGGRARRLRKALRPTEASFRKHTLPALHDKLANWQAMDYAALPRHKLIEAIDQLHALFARDIYVEAEKINLLAAFAMGEATEAAAGDPALRSHLMQADLPHAPASLIASCRGAEAEPRALALMGHRAIFDYELSTPRYSEAPSLLFSLLEPDAAPLEAAAAPTGLPAELAETVDLAVMYQDLKEQAKHESLRVFAELRRALVALGEVTGLGDLVFHLTLEEVRLGDWSQPAPLRQQAGQRHSQDRACRDLAPQDARLTLRGCERLSMGAVQSAATTDSLGGTCVSGEGAVTGRLFRVADETTFGDDAFAGFQPGDIIVCRMVNPAWLPQVQQAGAVLSEVGGWLSHMAIVAREKQIMMLVGCAGLSTLVDGQALTVSDDGSITLADPEDQEALRA